MIFIIIIAAAAATLLGGLFALKFKDKLHLVLGFSAGTLLGVVFFDLLPEAVELANKTFSISLVAEVIAFGFLFYLIIDRAINLHCHDGDCHNLNHRGRLGAGSLVVHSFLDGLVIGLAFQASNAIGLVVTAAVLIHKFSDGINTAGLVLKNNGTPENVWRWLGSSALAPALGIAAALFFTLPAAWLGLLLALFCGLFLYIGASDLLPESHHSHPIFWTTLSTLIGFTVIYFIVRLAGL